MWAVLNINYGPLVIEYVTEPNNKGYQTGVLVLGKPTP